MLKKLKWSQFEYHWDLWHLERVSRVGSDSRESSGDSRAPVAAPVTMNGNMVRPRGYISPCQPGQLLHPHVGSPAHQATVGGDHLTGAPGKNGTLALINTLQIKTDTERGWIYLEVYTSCIDVHVYLHSILWPYSSSCPSLTNSDDLLFLIFE